MFKVEHASFLFDVRLLCPNYRPTMHRDTWTNMATVVKTCMRNSYTDLNMCKS